EDGAGARILRARNGAIEAGELRPAKEGQTINRGELVRLSPRPDSPCFCNVEVLYKAPSVEAPSSPSTAAEAATEPAMSGPAQVATERYRDNWDRIFGSAARRRSAPN
ncbi:MAG TPA: hypothetical protein VGL13_02630, partial [Polyangiaceae bacterium]